MDQVITRLHVFPDYSDGFVFSWEINGSFNVRPPWIFHVEESSSPAGPWEDISGPVVDRFYFKDKRHGLINKSAVLYFRVVLNVGDETYFSSVLQPYGDLGKKDFLIAREVMRREVLHMKGMAGTAGRLFIRNTFGPSCTKCVDPITHEIRDSDCPVCMGTRKLNPYSGPFDAWMSFSQDANHEMQDDGLGTFEHKVFEVRLVANPVVKKNDIIVDTATDKRYYVNKATVAAEIRRIPLVQVLVVKEAPISDKIYEL